MLPRPQSPAQRAAALANRKKYALAPADRTVVSNSQLLNQAAPASVPVASVDTIQPTLPAIDQNESNKANLYFFSLSPADRAAVYADTHNLGPCKSCTPPGYGILPAVWSTWGTDWNLAERSWLEEVYV